MKAYQIWFVPSRVGLDPQYQELDYDLEETRNCLKLLASPDRSEGSLLINQQCWIYESKLDPGQELALPGEATNLCWLQLIDGKLITGDHEINKEDGVAYEHGPMPVRAIEESHFLYFKMA